MTDIKIRRQKRQSMMMRAVPGGIEVYIPHWMKKNAPQVKAFIRDGLQQIEDQVKPQPEAQISESDIRAMVKKWSPIIGAKPSRLQFRQMYRKWGSCSSKGTVTLNRALCWLPADLAEYVVVHELVHLLEMNHDKGWQSLMDKHMADWRDRQIKINGTYSTFGEC